MLNPEGHFPSSPGAHFGKLGSKRHSSSGWDSVGVGVEVTPESAEVGAKVTAVGVDVDGVGGVGGC